MARTVWTVALVLVALLVCAGCDEDAAPVFVRHCECTLIEEIDLSWCTPPSCSASGWESNYRCIEHLLCPDSYPATQWTEGDKYTPDEAYMMGLCEEFVEEQTRLDPDYGYACEWCACHVYAKPPRWLDPGDDWCNYPMGKFAWQSSCRDANISEGVMWETFFDSD